MNAPLGDVGVRARGLATHLLPGEALRRLARAAGSGVLAGQLQSLGYWPAPGVVGPAQGSADAIDAAIEHETARRLAVLARWLAERARVFCGVFEYEERRALRFRLRALLTSERRSLSRFVPGAAALPARLRDELAAAPNAAVLVAALGRARSPYAAPLEAALRAEPDQPRALEQALDRTFAERSLAAARRRGGRLLAWVREGIDLENAWDALAGGGGFVEGGRHFARTQHASVAAAPDEAARRLALSRAFSRTPLARIFDDAVLPSAALEARARRVRIANERRALRADPLGPSPILEFVLRLRAERAELRRINWGIAQGHPAAVLYGPMALQP